LPTPPPDLATVLQTLRGDLSLLNTNDVEMLRQLARIDGAVDSIIARLDVLEHMTARLQAER
jgi:tryptophan 2,3-dioxygenase